VTQNDELIARWRSEGECRRNIYSATKSFTAIAVGFAVQEGLIRLDEKLTDAFAGDLPETVCENLEKATVRDLLTMRLGQASGFLMGNDRPFYEEDDWVKLSLAQPFPHAPGESFVYNNVGPYLAGVLVQRRAGCDLVAYLTPRLFAPLGIKRPTWECDPLGNTFGAGGLFLTLTELHKFGLFCLQRRQGDAAAADQGAAHGVDHIAAHRTNIEFPPEQIGRKIVVGDGLAVHQLDNGDPQGLRQGLQQRNIRQPLSGFPLGNCLAADANHLCQFSLGQPPGFPKLPDGVSGHISIHGQHFLSQTAYHERARGATCAA
jgi:CubicO group peptidase (beta-lactamase class C family)